MRKSDGAPEIEGQWDVIVAFAGVSRPPATTGSTRWPPVGAPLIPLTNDFRWGLPAAASTRRRIGLAARVGRHRSASIHAHVLRDRRRGRCGWQVANDFGGRATLKWLRRDRHASDETLLAARRRLVPQQARAALDGQPAQRFVCQSCGAVTPQVERALRELRRVEHHRRGSRARAGAAGSGMARRGRGRLRRLRRPHRHDAAAAAPKSGIAEFDRVCGGGLVAGSAMLIGGDPGIGKSTLLLQVAAALARQGAACAYISGEEAVDQVRLRAERLGARAMRRCSSPRRPRCATSWPRSSAGRARPRWSIDSIQTMYIDLIDGAPGTVSQVRASAQELIRFAKRRGIAVLLVGHVTKDGAIAGPRVLEHMVDTVLYFEGERGHQFRILRAVKNRFGADRRDRRVRDGRRGPGEVANPSALFLAERRGDGLRAPRVFAGIEGTRPVLVEIQALVAPLARWARRGARWSAGIRTGSR